MSVESVHFVSNVHSVFTTTGYYSPCCHGQL